MAELDGPRRAPARGSADGLVVLLHGYGANGDDLITLADVWASRLPAVAFVSPHAPGRLPQPGMNARQWFPLSELSPAELGRGAETAAPGLERFLDAELARHGLPPSKLALVGFSQGTMMALHVGLRRKAAPAAIVGFSGVLAGPERLQREIACRPPVMLIHGAADDLIPVGAIDLTREVAAAAGVPVEWHVREGLGHGIDEAGIAMAGKFLAEHLR
ncbi:MAG: alpha/beta hydrolase [Hyphomicrobiaceae bacterium]